MLSAETNMGPGGDVTVYLGTDISLPRLRSKKSRKILRVPDVSTFEACHNLFFVCRASRLDSFASLLLSLDRQNFRGLLLLQDVELTFIDPLLREAKLGGLTKLCVQREEGFFERLNRILNAWEAGAADKLIADATVAGELLLVQSCDFKLHKIPFDSLKALARIPVTNRDKFEIASDGSYLRWEQQDIDLDLDAFRYAINPKWRAVKDREALMHNKRFGKAVAALRRDRDLTQNGFIGVSEREIRRIEKGQTLPRTSTLEAIASGHAMTLDEYLAEVARRIRYPQGMERRN